MSKSKKESRKPEAEVEPEPSSKEPLLHQNPSNKVNLLDVALEESIESHIELVRIGNDEIAVIPFTADGVAVNIHFCSEPEINSYVICNGPDCLLCRIGRKQDSRILLPVYLPTAGCIGVLPVSRLMRPHALFPQILPALSSGKNVVLFITRQMAKYTVSMNELNEDSDGGEEVVEQFTIDYNAGRYDLTSVYLRVDNKALSEISEISKMMALKGIRLDGDN